MIHHKQFVVNPPNTRENVEEVIEAKFHREPNEAMPKLLSMFIALLGEEKEDWGGVAAMKVSMKMFWKNGYNSKNHPTVKELEKFLFSPNLYVPIDIQRSEDRPSTTQAVISGAVGQTSIPPANQKTLMKRSDRPSTSQAVNPGAVGQTSVRKILKVKVYMGIEWKTDFPKPDPPSLFVNIKIQGDKSEESKKTKVQKKTWTPCWGEEFEFSVSRTPKDADLIVEVNDYHRLIRKHEFAGKTCQSVSGLKPGIHVIALSDNTGQQCKSARLLMRFIFN